MIAESINANEITGSFVLGSAMLDAPLPYIFHEISALNCIRRYSDGSVSENSAVESASCTLKCTCKHFKGDVVNERPVQLIVRRYVGEPGA